MPQYANSRSIGYNAWSNPAWSGFMNSYAATPLNTGATSGMRGITFSGAWSITAPWSGTYTMRAAADDFGSCNMGGNTFSPGGYSGGGNTTSRYFNKGNTIVMQWSIGNSGGGNGDDFNSNPCAIAWTLDGPSQPARPSVSLSLSPSTIIQGQSISLSWSASGVNLSSATLTSVSSPGFSGSATRTPSDDTTYTYTVTGEGGTTSISRTVVVYIPPQLILSAEPTTIIAGNCSTISWFVTGDGDSVTWTAGGLTNGNVTSNSTVCPTDTTTYTGYASGLGGTSPSASVTITVLQRPTIDSFSVPTELNYAEQGNVSYQSSFCNVSLTLQVYYRYTNETVLAYTLNLPKANSARLNVGTTTVSDTIGTDITYDDFGPRFVDYVLTAVGDGGTVQEIKTVEILIDETPDNFLVPETDGRFKDEEPVYGPNVLPATSILSELLYVDGIDIPVEIRSNYPIQVDINKEEDWKNVREL